MKWRAEKSCCHRETVFAEKLFRWNEQNERERHRAQKKRYNQNCGLLARFRSFSTKYFICLKKIEDEVTKKNQIIKFFKMQIRILLVFNSGLYAASIKPGKQFQFSQWLHVNWFCLCKCVCFFKFQITEWCRMAMSLQLIVYVCIERLNDSQ